MKSFPAMAAGAALRRHFTLCAVALSCALAGAPLRAASPVAAPVVLVVGDSLSAEYGLPRGTGWVARMEQRIAQQHLKAQVINASISGDTTAGGRARLPALLKAHQPQVVVLELGANDALRGLALSVTQDNLAQMARASKAAGAKVVVVGMQMPPNYGRQYADQFAALFATVAKQEGAALVPFMLKGVADAPNADALFQPDRIHPREIAHETILDNVWPVLRPLIKP